MVDLLVGAVTGFVRFVVRLTLGVLCLGAALAIGFLITLPAVMTHDWPSQAVTVGGDCRYLPPERTECLATWRTGRTTVNGLVDADELTPGTTVTARVDGQQAHVPRSTTVVVLWTAAALFLFWISPKPRMNGGSGGDGGGGDGGDGGGGDGGGGGGGD